MYIQNKTAFAVRGLVAVFLLLAAAFAMNLWGRFQPLPDIPLVNPVFTNTATVRLCIADKLSQGADPEDWNCYICHEAGKPPPLHFDTNHNVIVAEEHKEVVMGHGKHKRNNNCFNCHNEQNLLVLQTRDGHELKLTDSTPLCGSCHGPVYRDWEGGAHGRTAGYWNESLGERTRRPCAACHDPHSPPFPARPPAPGPHPLHAFGKAIPAHAEKAP